MQRGFNVELVIDLHCHVLPGIDDGPPDVDGSLQMAQAALDDGIDAIVATPHVNMRYGLDPDAIPPRVEELQATLVRADLPLSLLCGAEIALSRLPGLGEDQIRSLCLGHSSYVLIESPYSPVGSVIEQSLFELRVRGFRPVLAHPERCPEFRRSIPRLTRLVENGVTCSVSAGSIVGQFGPAVRRFAGRLLELGLVHNVSSDAHDTVRRTPRLSAAFRDQKAPLSNPDMRLWLTSTVPAAILRDEPIPPPPPMPGSSRWWRPTGRSRTAT